MIIQLDLYRLPGSSRLDPEAVLASLEKLFPDLRRIPGDQLIERANRAEAIAGRLGDKADLVIRTLRRNAKLYGPAIAFQILRTDESFIDGTVRPYDIVFRVSGAFEEGEKEKLLNFLKGLGAGMPEVIGESSH